MRFDAFVEASWGGRKGKFVVECKANSTPKTFRNAINQLKSMTLPKGYGPMLLVPFLREDQLRELEREGIGGIDLCGNGAVIMPGGFAVYRSGKKNLFSTSTPIKNIYRKNSSMVGRVFLVRPSYGTVQEIRLEINKRNILVNSWDKKTMSLSTVSKSLKALEEDLIVQRNDIIRLLQPDKLLENLSDNYNPPKITEQVRLKVSVEGGSIQTLLLNLSQELNLPIVATGTSSTGQFATMQRGNVLSVYCPSLETLLEKLPGNRTDRFPNLELIETEDERVFFDARQEGDFFWSSPVQVYLELMAGDKRDRETAEQVKALILTNLESERQ